MIRVIRTIVDEAIGLYAWSRLSELIKASHIDMCWKDADSVSSLPLGDVVADAKMAVV